MRRRDLFGLSAGALAGLAFAPPDEVRRVFPAGPLASVTLYGCP